MNATDRSRVHDAVRLLREGKRVRGVRLLDELAARYADDPRAHMQLGDAWLRGDERERAVACFLRAGELYFDKQFFKHATAMFRNVLDLEADHAHARQRLVDALVLQGLDAEAEQVQTALARRRPRAVSSTSPRPERPAVRAVFAFALGALFALGPIALHEAGWLDDGERTLARVVDAVRD